VSRRLLALSARRQRVGAPTRVKVPAGIAFAVALGVGVCACGGGAATQASGNAVSGSTLTIYEGSAPPSLNPMLQSSNQVPNNLAYDSLLVQTGFSTFTPALAESFQYIGDGNREVELTVRKNVRFSDGSTMTAPGLEAYMKAVIQANAISTGTFPVSGWSTPNSATLDISFSRAFPDAQLEFDQSGAFGTPVSAKELTSKQLGVATFGAGPYKLDASQTVAGTTYTFVKNPYYFAPAQQHWRSVVVKVIGNDASRLESVEAGSYSMEQGAPSENTTAKSAGLSLVSNSATSVYGMIILDRQGQIVPALGNQKVREALNYAIDRPADAKALDGTPTEQVAAAGYVGHYGTNVYSYSPATAKELLTEAGYPRGFTLPILYESTDPLSSTVAQLLAADFQAIGVKVEFTTAPSIQAYGSDMNTGKYPAAIQQMQGMAFTVTTARIFLPGGLFNPIGKTAPTASFEDQYLAASAASGAAETTAWANLGRYITQNAWLDDVVAQPSTYYASKDLNVPAAWGVFPDPVYMTPAS
jgi:peptide/nickel transport system substrate-binding protein